MSSKNRRLVTRGPDPYGEMKRPAEDHASTAALSTPHVDSMDSLEEISEWLGTFRERLRLAREHERPQVATVVQKLEARHRRRREELA